MSNSWRIVLVAIELALCAGSIYVGQTTRYGLVCALSWLAVCGIGFLIGRWPIATTRTRLNRTEWLVIALGLLLVALMVVAALESEGWPPPVVRWAMWLFALATGASFGRAAARAAARWRPVVVRAVVGTSLGTAYRTAAPPAYSPREAAPRPRAAIIAACVRAGYRVGARGRRLQLFRAGEPALRLRATCHEPWQPEHLRLTACDGASPTELVAELATEYGPLAFMPDGAGATILEPRSW
jgi:hypothetical protein